MQYGYFDLKNKEYVIDRPDAVSAVNRAAISSSPSTQAPVTVS